MSKAVVRCPGHTIHFLGFGYSLYVGRTLQLTDISLSGLEVKEYDPWEN